MYNNGSNYGSGHLMGGLNPLQLTSGSTNSSLSKLSFLNPTEQTKFEQLFSQNASGLNQQLTGEAARDIFLRSKLDAEVLAQIWSMADINATGSLTFPEFALAMYLINMKLTGQNVPSQLPNNLRQEIVSAMQPGAVSNVGTPYSGTPNIGTPNPTYSGYHQSGPSILGVTTPLSSSMDARSTASTQYSGYQNPGLTKSQWAVTPEEKAQFDQIFKSLDNAHSGFLSGERARQVFTESGLNKSDLAQIWDLADIHNQGKLNSDEFAVAMHLIYAKLAGQDIPRSLPANLIPRSTKDLSDSVSSLKQMLRTSSSYKKSSAISSPILGIPKLDLDTSNLYANKKASSRDEDVGYVSSNRRKVGTSPKPSSPSISYSERLVKFDSLRKQIKEKQAELDSMLTQSNKSSISASTHNEVDLTDLKMKIRHLQDSINETSVSPNDLPRGHMDYNPEAQQAERKKLESEFDEITKELMNLAKEAHDLDDQLADSKLELFKIVDAKLHKTAAPKTNLANLFPFKAAGSNENLSEADKLKQKAAEMLAQRMQALTKTSANSNDPAALEAKKRLDVEVEKINHEKQQNHQQVREVESTIDQLQKDVQEIIQRSARSAEQSSYQPSKVEYEREKKKWDSRTGLEMETKKFLDELRDRERKPAPSFGLSSSQQSKPSFISSSSSHSVTGIPSKISSVTSKPSLVALAKSKEEKDRMIKEEAERRLKERQSYFQEQLKRTKDHQNTAEHMLKSSEEKSKPVTDNSDGNYHKNFQQKAKGFSTTNEGNDRSPIQSTIGTSSGGVPPPPPPPVAVNAALGGYKTLWLNKPSSENNTKPIVSTVPSFISKSNSTPFQPKPDQIRSSPVVAPSLQESSDDDAEQERIFRERIKNAKNEEKEKSKAPAYEQERVPTSGLYTPKSTIPSFIPKPNNPFPSSNSGKAKSHSFLKPAKEEVSEDRVGQEKPFSGEVEKAKPQMNQTASTKTPAFLMRSNNTSTAPSFNTNTTKPPSEPSHSPKDDEWDVVEKEPASPTSAECNLEPGHTKRFPSSLFSSISTSIPSPSPMLSNSKFDEAFGTSLKSNEMSVPSTSTTFDDAFDIPPEPSKNQQESPIQSEQLANTDEVLFRVRALYDYQSEGADDLSFGENEYIEVSQASEDNDWWYGKLESNGAKGWFPKSYVERESDTLDQPDGQHTFQARVLYDYLAQQDDELSVNADAVIEIVERIDENWWRAQVEGHIGLVPATYCEELPQ